MQALDFDRDKYITIAVDGLDGSGKGACVGKMSEIITSKGCPVIISAYPNYEYPWGKFLDHLLHENDEGLSLDDRLLVYALNRLETVQVIQNIVKTYIDVYGRVCVLFDRYPTSAMLTLSYYKISKGIDFSIQKLLDEYLPKMWEVDKYFIEYLNLHQTPVVVPILDAEQTMSRLLHDTNRKELDSYEKSDVQDLARSLYLKASQIESRIITFSQFDDSLGRYMTIEENANMALSLTWPSVIKDKVVSKKAPIHEIGFDPTLVDKEALSILLNEQGSSDLKRFDPYK